MPPVLICELPRDVPGRGVYLLSEEGRDLYVGRSNTIRTRLRNHCREKAGHNQATFAMRLAREATGRLKATYRKEGGRDELVADPVFGPKFAEAKARVRRMHVRYVEEGDPMRQALLEMYAALALRTPYNDFDNH